MVRRRAQRMGTGVNVSSRTLILEHELQDGERAAGSMNELIAQHEVMFGRPPIEEDLRRTMSRMTSLKRREFIPRDLVSTVFGQWKTCDQPNTLIPTDNINWPAFRWNPPLVETVERCPNCNLLLYHQEVLN